MSSEPVFRFLVLEEGETHRVEVEGLPITIGRADAADIRLAGTRCSRKHARLEESPGGVLLVDLNSGNGTFVDGESIHQVVVTPGARFSIGEAEITYLERREPHAEPPVDITHTGLVLDDEIGKGVVSRVFKAQQAAMNRSVVVKFLRVHWHGSLAVEALFKDRTREQSRVSHRTLASVIDFGDERGVPYCVLEYLDGRTIADLVGTGWRFDATAASGVMREILELLENMHAQGRHLGALDPDAILVSSEGTVGVTSLGFQFPSVNDQPDEFVDELAWLAPEAVPRPRDAGVKGDLHLVGAMARYLLEGHQPRRAATRRPMLKALAEEPMPVLDPRLPISAALRELIEALTAPDPDDRPESARAALDVLEAAAGDLPAPGEGIVITGGKGRGAGPPSRGMSRRQFKIVSWSITGALMIILNAGVFLWFRAHGDEVREWFGAGPAEEEIEQPTENSEDPPVTPRATTPSEREQAKKRWNELMQANIRLLEAGDFSAAATGLERFSDLYPDSDEARKAAGQLSQVMSLWRSQVEVQIARLRQALEASDADAAHAAVLAAREMGAERTHPADFRALTTRLERLVAGEEKADPPTRDPVEVSAPKVPPVMPSSAWEQELPRALKAPGDTSRRKALLDSLEQAGDPGTHGSLFRLLQAEDRIFKALVESLAGQVGKPIALDLGPKKKIAGILRESSEAGLVLDTANKTESVSWRKLPLLEWLPLLERLPATCDRYLVQAWFNRHESRPEEAWFDLHAARMLSAQDDAAARKLTDEILAELAKRHGR